MFKRMTRIPVWVFLITLLAAGLHGAEGGYLRKWIWSKKELKKVAAIEKKVKQETGDFGKIYVVDTPNWHVKTEINPHFTAEVAVFMEIFSSTFWEIYDFNLDTKLRIKPTIVIYDSKAKYMKKVGMSGSRGVFTHAYRSIDDDAFVRFHLYTYMQKDRLLNFKNCYLPVIQHEGTHAMLQTLMGKRRIPCWLNEGMATFFEFWDYHGGGKPAGRRRKDKKARHARLCVSYRKNELRPGIKRGNSMYPRLSYLLALGSHRRWDPDCMGETTRFHYALAESFIDFLMWDKKGRKVLKAVFQRLAKTGPRDNPDKFELITTKEIAKLEPRWYKFLANTWGINAHPPKKK